jgi:hypothetical protein
MLGARPTMPQKQRKKQAPESVAAIKAHQFKPGQSGNPGGKAVGTRNQLQGDFVRELAEDFAKHGRAAIVEMRENKGSEYIKVIASLMPKEIDIGTRFGAISDDELAAGIAALQSLVAAQGIQAGRELALADAQVIDVQTVQ